MHLYNLESSNESTLYVLARKLHRHFHCLIAYFPNILWNNTVLCMISQPTNMIHKQENRLLIQCSNEPSQRYQKKNMCYLPNIVRFSAQTSNKAFSNSLRTQWYWNWCCFELEQFCFIFSQFILLAAISQDLLSVGHSLTYLIFVADSLQKVNGELS